MRLALVRRRFSPTGGAEHYAHRLAEAIVSRGHEVAVACESWLEMDNAPFAIRAIPTQSPRAFADAIRQLGLHREFDLVFSLERVPGADIYRAGDGVHAEWLRRRAEYSPWLGNIRNVLKAKNNETRQLEAEVFDDRRTGWVIANSEMVREDIERHFAFARHRIRVIRNGVPYRQFSSGDRSRGRTALGISADEFVVLLVGSGEERKGVKYAQAATRKVPGARFVLIDSPPPCLIEDVYAAADVFLLPTLYDPFANVTLEALAAGLPVITTVHNGGSEILVQGKTGFILDRADDVAAMAKFLKMLQDAGLRQEMRAAAQTCARDFDLSRNVDETLALCEEVASHPKPWRT